MSGAARIYVIGAGFAGRAVAREISEKGVLGRVVAFLDDDPAKIGQRLDGIPVLGPIEQVVSLVEKTPADEALIAIPSATRESLRTLYETLRQASFSRIRILPTVSQITGDEAHVILTREIDPQDLLGRTPVNINLREALSYLRGRRVLITGAGGSIGSELARQLLFGGAERLYLLGHGENSIYEIDAELRLLQEEGVGESTSIVPIIGELTDREYVQFLLTRLHADVIFHTAAYKHVPMMEANPVAAIQNNVFGTRNLVEAAREAGVDRLVLVSTDKAVKPTSVYGVAKRLAEEIVLCGMNGGTAPADEHGQTSGHGSRDEHGDTSGHGSRDEHGDTSGHGVCSPMVVRFGNVLGSRGSILPLFRRQIETGGPVTITDPGAKRFFMTIPEAVSLVLKAGGVGDSGELYVLDMGEPVNIRELAEQLIQFYGPTPGREISIREIGLRPGEKMEESLFDCDEVPRDSPHERIMRVERQGLDRQKLREILDRLEPVCFLDRSRATDYRNRWKLRSLLQEFFPDLRRDPQEPEY